MNNPMMNNLEMDELFTQWSEDRETQSPRPLKEWTTTYPQHAQQLAQWSVTTTLLELAPNPVITAEMEAQTRAIGRSVLAETRVQYEANLPALVSINTAAKARGLNLNTLAQSLGLSAAIMQKLDMRSFRFDTLPAILLARIAEMVEVSTAQVRNYLRQNATLAQGVAYKSDTVPQVAAQGNFADAIQSDLNMTSEQKAAWLTQDGE